MKNSVSKTNHNLSESFKGLSDSRYYVTGRKKYAPRKERIKEVPSVQETLSLIHHNNIGSDELSVSKTQHHDDDIWGENIWDEEEEEKELASDISEMSTERILMNDALGYEVKEAVIVLIVE